MRLRGPVGFAPHNCRAVAEVVGAHADHDEMRSKSLAILHERVIILFRRVADMPGVEDRHRQLPCVTKLPLEVGRRSVAVSVEHGLHEPVAQHDPPHRSRGSGSAPRRPHEFVC